MAEALYTGGVVRSIADFHANITQGNFSNATVPPRVRSNLTAIRGHTACYENAKATWDEMWKTAKKL